MSSMVHETPWERATASHQRALLRAARTMRWVTGSILPAVGAHWQDRGMHEGGSTERPAIFFDDAEDFRAWLEANHESATELWMGLNKKHVEARGLQWAEAVREALCYG